LCIIVETPAPTYTQAGVESSNLSVLTKRKE